MRRTALFSGIVLLALAGLAGCGGDDADGAPAAAGGPPGGMQLPVETVTIQPRPLQSGLDTVGSLRADESVVVRPEVAGRIQRIHFTEGGTVRAGQPLFTLDASLARASYNEAAANLANSRSANTRAQELARDQLIARSDADNTRAALAVDRARVASAQAALAKMTLTAPFSGQVGLREVSVGEFVNVGQDLVTLVRLDPIEVDFSLPETAMSQLRTGQNIRLTVDAYPDDTFGGEVVAIDPVIDPASRSARVRARIPNPDGRLHPGQFARLQLQTGAGGDALMVPEQALMQDGETRYVYTVVDGKAKRTPITTGVRVPGFFQVVEGLQAGDVVITAGQAKPMMQDGMPVVSVPPGGASAAAPAGQAARAQAPAAESPAGPSETTGPDASAEVK
ncbi:efflux RND transporter periplasmic adaptor subunit [Lysobacter sp. A3-1-A15]|uniref:efflux RND transporter periplasmic adaptor subunit n=1 Tax=Novilysobacter viscosus TaxID=3098602 RepID=UPI002ED96D9C